MLLYEGKAKKIFEAENGRVTLFFKDDATAGNRAKEAQFKGKGQLNCEISAILFEMMRNAGIKTHYISKKDERTHLCHKLNIIPIEVIVRNIAAGTFCKRYGLDVGQTLDNVIVEWCVKDDDLNDPPICDDAITALGMATIDTLNH